MRPSSLATLGERLRERLAAIEAQGLTRTLRPPAGIDFSSNDYLGLARHPLLEQRMAEAVLTGGVGSTGSRLLRGERESFARVEEKFARFKGTERSLYFSSGYLANLAVLATLAEAGDVIYSDERNHASLIDGTRLSRARVVIFPHNDAATLRQMIRDERCTGERFIVVESLFSMDGDEAPLAEYATACRETGACLIVDEAHAVGIYGATGSGLIEQRGIASDVLVSINTAGKAMGVSGAFVAGPEEAIAYLIQRARPFIFSTAAPPAIAAALEASLETIASEPERRSLLLHNAQYLRRRLKIDGVSQIIPVMIGANERAVEVARDMQAAGFDVRAVRPPAVPAGTARLRVSVNARLTEEIMDRFAVALERATGQA
jgi:8-amino-7-oxononanoate synthase